MENIKDIIPKVIAPLSEGKMGLGGIVEAWQRLGTPKTSSVEALKDGCLTIHVDSAARRVRMELEKDEYLRVLNKTHPEIKAIRFKVGKIT